MYWNIVWVLYSLPIFIYPLNSANVIVQSIGDFLLPLFLRLPTRKITPSNDLLSTPLDKVDRTNIHTLPLSIQDTLDYCTEQLSPISGRLEIDENVQECVSRDMGFWSQLPSEKVFQNYKRQRVCMPLVVHHICMLIC